MKEALLLFSHSSHWKDRLFRFATGSVWSGLALVLPQERGEPVFVIGLDPVSGHVSKMPLANRVMQVDRVSLMTIADVDVDAVTRALFSQINKSFDWIGLFSRKRREKHGAWLPGELMAWALDEAGCRLFDSIDKKVTLEHFWALSSGDRMIKREIVKTPSDQATGASLADKARGQAG